MSLSSLAIRICTIEALRGATLVGDAIEDSPIDAVSLAVSAAGPLVAIFSDREHFVGDSPSLLAPHSRQGVPGHTVDLTFNIFLPTEQPLTVPGSDTPLKIDVRDSGAALVFDILYRQIQTVLTGSQNPWATLWRQAVNTVLTSDQTAYVLQTDKGLRLPSREITWHLDVLDDPELGGEASDFWTQFVTALQGSDDLADLAPVIQGMINGDAIPDWRALQAYLGLNSDGLTALGDGPLGGGANDTIVSASQVTVENEDSPDPPLVVTDGTLNSFEP